MKTGTNLHTYDYAVKPTRYYPHRLYRFSCRQFQAILTIYCHNAVVDVDSVDLFKSDNFWMFQDVKYDYTANLAVPEIDLSMTLKVIEKL